MSEIPFNSAVKRAFHEAFGGIGFSSSRGMDFLRELERLGWKMVGPEPSGKMVWTLGTNFHTATPQELRKAFAETIAASPTVDELLEGEK